LGGLSGKLGYRDDRMTEGVLRNTDLIGVSNNGLNRQGDTYGRAIRLPASSLLRCRPKADGPVATEIAEADDETTKLVCQRDKKTS
jgi:hypothetical protein